MGDLAGLDTLVPIGEVLAIEAFPDVTSAPFVMRPHDACAVVAVWLKKR